VSPEISILLPVYNGAVFLEAAFESLFAQSFQDFEIIVCDDGSKDESAAIIERMKGRDARVKSFANQKNVGLFANYNCCLKQACGQYIKPFAQDDTLAVHCLESMLDVLKKDQSVSLVTCARNIIDAEGNVVETKRIFAESCLIKGSDVILYNLISLTNWIGEPATAMFRKEHAGTGFDTSFFHLGDAEMWFQLLLKGNYYFIDEVLATFRRHDHNATKNNLAGLLFALDALAIGKKYRHILDDFGESEEHYLLRVAEFAAMQVDHLVRNEGLTAEKAVQAAVKGADINLDDGGERARRVMQSMVELNFISLRALTNTITSLSDVTCRLQSEREYLNKKIENINNSTSWKLTAPLRKLIGGQA